jgi:hypothetical protein
VVKPGATVAERRFPWYWNPHQQFALAGGVSCFRKGLEYAHGGLSLQECLVMEIVVTADDASSVSAATVEITDISWKGMRCKLAAEGDIDGLFLDIRQLKSRTVKAGEEELFKAHAREKGEVRIIDLLSARLDAKTDSYLATLPSLQLKDVRISSELVNAHERMLTGGFYAEIALSYDAAIAQEKNGRPFGVESLREIQLSIYSDARDALLKAITD